MKKLSIWCLVVVMIVSTILPMSGFADEVTDGTETTQTENVVLFDYDFEDYASSDTTFPKSKTENVTEGSWSTTMASAGNVVGGIDGNRFKFTKEASSGMYATYSFSPYITGGKYLFSFDIEYNMLGTHGREAWTFTNKVVTDNGDGTTSTSSEYLYLLNLENPSGNGPSIFSPVPGGYNNRTRLFTAKKDETYTVDVLIDFDTMTKTYFVDGVQKDSYQWTGDGSEKANISQIKINLNSNIAGLDNFKIIKNPTKYTFTAEDTTTENEWITVKFSNTVNASASDFAIMEKVEEVEEPTQIAVSEIERITGSMYRIKPATALSAGNYTVSLVNTELASVIGTTSSNTTADFNVKSVKTYFDMDFEEFTNITSYMNLYAQNGVWTWPSGGSCKAEASNTNRFEGDSTNGIAGTGTDVTKKWKFTLDEPVTSGVVRISFDAAFDTTKTTNRSQFVFINDSTSAGCVMNYGKTASNGGLKYVLSGGTALKVLDSNPSVAIEDNVPHRWDIVIDLDNKILQNYCDGTRFGSVNFGTTQTQVSAVSIMLLSATSFFDNYKVTHNVETFGYTASDIASDSNETIVNFDDTMVLADSDFVFTNPDGETVVPDSVTKITQRKYKVALPDLTEGTYTMSLADGKTSALGNTPKIESVSFNVAARPVQEFVATDLAIADAEGGAVLSAKITNSFAVEKSGVMLIALYNENDEMVECYAEEVPVDARADAVEKSITMTTDKDLSAYTVKGFAWSVEDSFYPLCNPVTK